MCVCMCLQVVWEENRNFAAIAEAVCKVTDVELDQYWVASRFFQHVAKYKDTIAHYVSTACLRYQKNDGGGGIFLACEDFLRMFDNSFPACAFFLVLFKVEISSRKLIPLFRPGSVHSGSVS